MITSIDVNNDNPRKKKKMGPTDLVSGSLINTGENVKTKLVKVKLKNC